jgi:hypothetical protein
MSDTTESASTQALLDLSNSIGNQGVPLIVTDLKGKPTAVRNLPSELGDDEELIRDYVRELDRQNCR